MRSEDGGEFTSDSRTLAVLAVRAELDAVIVVVLLLLSRGRCRSRL